MRRTLILAVILAIIGMASPVGAAVESGRHISRPDRAFYLNLTYGQITEVDGEVRETKRAGDADIPGKDSDYYDKLESYSLAELGFDGNYDAFGFEVVRQWKFLTLALNAQYAEPSGGGTAEREPFAIGVSEVAHNGKEYDYMLIPQGDSFKADLRSVFFKAKALITPIHMNFTPDVIFSPWIHLGFTAALNYYEIDAGPSRGVTTYEAYPHQYVIGGTGKGWAGLAVPDIGLGGEVKIRMGQMNGQDVFLSLQGDFALLDWAGSTSDIGANSRNEKDVSLDYMAHELRVMLELPISKTQDLLLGMTLQYLDADAEVEARDRTDEERLETLEKYDKEIEYTMTTFYVFAGLRF